MKSGTYKVFAIISTVLFILISAKVGYDFYNLDEIIVREVEIVEVSKKKNLTSIILRLAIFGGIAFFSGILAILLTNIANSGSKYADNINAYDPTIDSDKDLVNEINNLKNTKSSLGLSALGEINKVLNSYSGEERLEKILSVICKNLDACQGAIYALKKEGRKNLYVFQTGYAYYIPESQIMQYELGEGLIGQVAKDGTAMLLKSVPEGYMQVISGLGQASPKSLLIVPIHSKDGNEIIGVFEVASFVNFTELQKNYVQEVSALLSEKITDSLVATV
ncbi:MAG: GAF domain-containing protein [Raineya sp.]|jgi:putative methionine-R-sulfoxide reductase with GAF domain|nr:GAF domain-containing protein [Raineya sp.]